MITYLIIDATKMDSEDIHEVTQLLSGNNIILCYVGELAFNYYNVPRIIHDLEICVVEADLEKATNILSASNLFHSVEPPDHNLYTDFKRDFPRFRHLHGLDVVLLPDTFLHLNPLPLNIAPHYTFQEGPEYSVQIMDLIPASEIDRLPVPQLVPFFRGMCRRYLESKDDAFAIAVEGLIDGMDLDERWCEVNLKEWPEESRLALKFIEGKLSRISDFSPNEITCHVRDRNEAHRLRQIPGA